MDTVQIIKTMGVLFGRKKKKIQFGCIPCDKLDNLQIKSYPFAICINDQPSGMPGAHWIGIYIEKRRKPMEFFCSYGKPIKTYADHFVKFAQRNHLKVNETNICLQSPFSEVCGHYVLYYLYNRLNGCSRNAFYAKFSKHLERNDKIVYTFVKKFIEKIK